jgi:hypothetical protein
VVKAAAEALVALLVLAAKAEALVPAEQAAQAVELLARAAAEGKIFDARAGRTFALGSVCPE